jgi:hypothetical protein
MAPIKDLLPPDVRRALAGLATAQQPTVTDDLRADPPEHADEPADREAREQNERRPASPSQRNHAARQSLAERPYRKPRACVNVIHHTRFRGLVIRNVGIGLSNCFPCSLPEPRPATRYR